MYLESPQPLQRPEHWEEKKTFTSIQWIAPTKLDADIFLDRNFAALQRLASDNGKAYEIAWKFCDRPFRVRPKVAAIAGSGEPSSRPRLLRGVIQSAVDLDWTAIHGGNNPIYINELKTQRNLYLNEAAVAAQSGKPPAEFLSATAHVLNFEEELTDRCRHLMRDRRLQTYSYLALRWFQDEETGIWIRRQMSFVSNFWRVSYLGCDCWMGEVLQALPVGTAYGDPIRPA